MIASIIVFFLLFLLPFIIAPFGVTQFENPKVIFAEIGIIILFLISLFSNRISFQNRPKQLLIFSAIFVVTVIDLFFFRTPLSFFGNAFRMQGIFLLWLFLLFSFLIDNVPFGSSGFFLKWWVFCLLLYLEVLITFFLPLNASLRYVGTLGEPNALAAFAIFLWPFGWFSVRDKKSEIISKALLIIPVIILLYLSGSRSGMIAFGIEILFLILSKFFVIPSKVEESHTTQLPNRRNTYATQLTLKRAAFICLLVYVFSYILPFVDQALYENRVEVWQSAFFAGIINPGLGQGFGNTEIALHNAAAGLGLPVQYYYVDSSHNIFLDWWVQGGVFGISLLIFLVYQTFIAFIKQKKKRELVLFLGMITILSFNPASIVGLLGFWWLIGRSSAP
ncbi:MAG TPA: O-antigen ligase family protein [Candidatus Saccharimonadales bacterium]|nr:O-antigen ligase family protein [Candidatus Saccharimonadales bacterium]